MEVKNHLLYKDGKQVDYRATPNFSSGTKNPLYIVAHFDAASNSTSAVNWLTQKGSNVSADLHIAKSGKITQMAPFSRITWHAGASSYEGLTGLNKYSIGIEIENRGKVNGVYEDYTKAQIDAFVEIGKALVKAYPSIKKVVGHEDIATPRGRKDDPGPKFPMAEVNRRIFGENNESSVSTKRTTSDLHIREGAGTQYKSLGVLKKGTEVNVLREENGFSEVFVCNTKQHGWSSSVYLK